LFVVDIFSHSTT